MTDIDFRPHVIHQTKKLANFKERVNAWKEHLHSPFTKAVKTVEVAAGAYVGGVVQGKGGPDGATIAHVPIDLLAGIGLNLAAAFHLLGKENSGHAGNFGDGMIAAYVSGVGFKLGQRWHETGHLFGHGGGGGSLPAGPGPGSKVSGSLSHEQLAEIVNRVQAAGG